MEKCKNEMKIELVPNSMECLNRAASGFKIARIINGQIVLIELTCQEVYNAFLKKEREHHIADIEAILDDLENDAELRGITAKEINANAELKAKILEAYEDNLSNGMEWRYAVISAIKEALEKISQYDAAA